MDARIRDTQKIDGPDGCRRTPSGCPEFTEFKFTISMGLAIAEPGESFEATIRRADLALDAAKQSRDTLRWAAPVAASEP